LNEFVTVTDVVEHAFCPMFTYFRLITNIPQNEKRRGTVQKGREVHEIRQHNNPKYIPKNINKGVKIRAVTLYSQKLGLIGKIDHAIITNNNIILFEQKYSKPFINQTLRVQLGLLSLLLEEKYNKKCDKAQVQFLQEPRKTIHVTINKKMRKKALNTLIDMKKVINDGRMPHAHYDGRCADCTYHLICPVGSLKRNQ